MIFNSINKYVSLFVILNTVNIQAVSLEQLRAKCRALVHRAAFKKPMINHPFVTKAGLALPAAQETQHPRLDSFAYKIKAREILNKTLILGKGLPNDYIQFLNEQSSLERRMKTGKLDVEKACRNLNPSWVFPFVINNVNRDSGATFLYAFVNANQHLVAHRIRRALNCHTGSLDIFEWNDALRFAKVSENEYSKRLNSFKKGDIEKITIEEASALSTHMLEHSSKE